MGIFNEAVKDRQKQQNRIEAKGTHTEEQEQIERTIFSLSITKEDKKKLQLYSIEHGKTIASIIHEWIHEHCN